MIVTMIITGLPRNREKKLCLKYPYVSAPETNISSGVKIAIEDVPLRVNLPKLKLVMFQFAKCSFARKSLW